MSFARLAALALALALTAPASRADEAWRQALERAASLSRDAGAAHRDGNEADAEKYLRAAVAALPPQVPPPGRDEARRTAVRVHRLLAEVQQTTGRMDDARASLLLARVQAQGDAEAVADVTNDVGLLDWQQGNLDAAEAALSKALAAYGSLKAEHMQAVVRGNLGLIALDRFTESRDGAQLEAAERHFIHARDAFLKDGSKADLANQWSNLGLVYRNQKKYVPAAKAHQEGLKLDRAAGNRLGEVDSLGNLGRVAEDAGDIWKARDLYRQAFDLARRIGYARGIAHHGLYLMELLNKANRPAEANPYGPPALAAAERLGKQFTIAAIRQQMAVSAR